MKKINPLSVLIVMSIFLILIFSIWYFLYFSGPKINNFQNPHPAISEDKDAHGCLISRGYSWCDVKQDCIRLQEEKCGVPTTTSNPQINFVKIGNLIEHNGQWFLIYEEPGAPALQTNLNFTSETLCVNGSDNSLCDISKLIQGTRVKIEGKNSGNEVLVLTIYLVKKTESF